MQDMILILVSFLLIDPPVFTKILCLFIIQDGAYTRRVEELKNYVRSLLLDSSAPLARVELINHLQRLGIGYLFEEEIRILLDTIWKGKDFGIEKDLNAMALQFRILRQNGYYASNGTVPVNIIQLSFNVFTTSTFLDGYIV